MSIRTVARDTSAMRMKKMRRGPAGPRRIASMVQIQGKPNTGPGAGIRRRESIEDLLEGERVR
jgi:hypothetical protein